MERRPKMQPNKAKQLATNMRKSLTDIEKALTFYVNVLSLYSASTNSCVSSIAAEATVYQQNVNLEATGTTVSAEIKLWSSGGIIGSNRERHRQLLSQEIEDLAKRFVTAWNLDNKDHSDALTFDEFTPKAGKGPYDDLIPKKGKGEYDEFPFVFTRGPAAAVPPGVKPVTAADLPQPPVNAASNPSASSTLADSKPPKPNAKTGPEVVTVKYRGPVSLAPFKCDAITRSSFIERVCYDAANSYMLIDLTGRWYHYCEIDPGTVSSLMAADFTGRFYNQSIKGRFDCRTHLVPEY